MASDDQQMTEYERRRLENIKRNGEMMASLQIKSHLSHLSKLHKVEMKKCLKKKPVPETEPNVTRRSLRNQGMHPDDDSKESLPIDVKSMRCARPLRMTDAHKGGHDDSHRAFVEKFTTSVGKEDELLDPDGRERQWKHTVDLKSLRLEPGNVAQVVPKKIFVHKFLPTVDMRMVVAGDAEGNLGFWDVKAVEEDGNGGGIYMYRPHKAPVTGISIQPFLLSKMYTCCDDGFLKLMDIEKEVFDLVYSSISRSALFSLSHRPNDANSIYFAEGRGYLNMFDTRAGKILNCWSLHEGRINSTDFNPENNNIMATTSRDGLVCLWDLRKIGSEHTKSNAWLTVELGEVVNSAYFSPSGSCLATTSVCDRVGVLSGLNYEDRVMINHENAKTYASRSFRAVWGWDDTFVYIGNMDRKIYVLSVAQRKMVYALESPLMSSVPQLLDAHPFAVGTLAGATTTCHGTGHSGQVYVWASSQ